MNIYAKNIEKNKHNYKIKRIILVESFKMITFLSPDITFCLAITLTVISLILLFISLNKTIKNKYLIENYTSLQTNFTRIEQRFADSTAQNRKYEQENRSLQIALIDAEREMSAIKASSAAREEAMVEKITYLEKIKEDLSLKFKDISAEIIKSQHESFTSEQKNTLSAVLNPFAEQLKAFKTEVSAAREESIKHKSGLDAQLATLSKLNQSLSKDAQNLTEALKGGKKTQGNWGECQLNRVLEISGLRKGIDYETQGSYQDEEKNLYRPDVIIHLPENRDIIVDSKVSLVDYLAAINTEDEKEQEQHLRKNTASLKAHIDELAAKEYQKLLKDTSLNYVIMFIPVESAYIAALDSDNTLYDYAYKRNVILATPLSLLPTLRTVENLWRIDSQNRNVQKIADLGGKIYDKLAAFVEDMKTLERGINQANNAYTSAMTKLQGRGGALSQAEKMRLLGSKTNKNINLPLNDTDLLLEDNTTELTGE
ncbi:MAG: DNA recombination protein RmuC [Acetobacter sp.]|nr:DNA recombination protein RmuC [Acetobacter sp.]